jgi:hypothetical protein
MEGRIKSHSEIPVKINETAKQDMGTKPETLRKTAGLVADIRGK